MAKRVRTIRPPPVNHERPKNKLLACLPEDDFNRLRPHLKTVPVKVKQVLHRRNEPVREVFFPNGGVASITMVMKDGAMVETATVGDEGLIGLDAAYGDGMSATESMMQVPDTNAEVMTSEAFKAEILRRGALRVRTALLAGAGRDDHAIDGLHGASPGAGSLLSLASDRARSRPAGRLRAQP